MRENLHIKIKLPNISMCYSKSDNLDTVSRFMTEVQEAIQDLLERNGGWVVAHLGFQNTEI